MLTGGGLRIFLRVILASLQAHCPSAVALDRLAPNSPLRAAVTAMVPMPEIPPIVQPVASDQEAQANAKRSPARYLWAKLIARIYEVFPLLCLYCCGQMRLIAFINDGAEIRKILDHIGIESNPPKISKARGPPLWDACDEAEPEEYIDDAMSGNMGPMKMSIRV